PRMSYSRKMVGFNIRSVLLKVTLTAYESVSFDEESQGPVGAVPDADARGNADTDFCRAGRGADGQEPPGEINSVVAAGDTQSQGQLPRAVGQILDAAGAGPAAAHAGDPFQGFHGTDQHTSWTALRLGD